MTWKGRLADYPPTLKVVVLAGLCISGVSIFSAVGYFAASLCGINLFTEPGLMNHLENPQVVQALKIIQSFSAIGLFILPPIIAAFLFSASPGAYLRMDKGVRLLPILLFIFLLIAATPIVNYLFYLNKELSLPVALKGVEEWMQHSEEQATLITEAFLNVSTFMGLLVNLFVVALLPAIGEELLFRGIIQRLLSEGTGNKHLAVVVAAAIFSAFHMQFYGFIPRMALGILLGYSLLWSGSLWLPIAGHFINNAVAVIFAYVAQRNQLPFNQDTIGAEKSDYGILVLSCFIVAAAMVLLYRTLKTRELSE